MSDSLIDAVVRHPTKPRLRFDRVALRLVTSLQAALADLVPDGQAVIITVTAPIRLPSKTATALEAIIRERLARRTARLEVKETINGNHARARLVRDPLHRTSKVVGFVHNPDSDPDALLDLTESLLRADPKSADRTHPRSTC